MMLSLIEIYGKNLLSVIMTGMGKDGFDGVKALKKLGGYCITQDEASCVVYGMPKAVSEAGLSDAEVPLEKIPELINKLVKHEQYI
jgi:two-component system chemotaxis response regulator CheB